MQSPSTSDEREGPVIKRSSRCVVCKAFLSPSTDHNGRTCMQWSCQQELARRKREGFGQQKCAYCLLPLDVHRAHAGVCADTYCQAAKRQEYQVQEASRRAALLAAKIEELRAFLGSDKPGAPYVFQVPASEKVLVPCESIRREQLNAHLNEVFDEWEALEATKSTDPEAPALSDAPQGPEDSASVERKGAAGGDDSDDADDGVSGAMIAGACRTCQGFCCYRGEEHGYIKVETIARVKQREPLRSRAEIIATYVGAVEEKNYEGSCIFHGETGCALPFSWRSETCNTYYCGAMHRFLARGPDLSQDVVAVATSQNEIVRVARFTEEEYVPLETADSSTSSEE